MSIFILDLIKKIIIIYVWSVTFNSNTVANITQPLRARCPSIFSPIAIELNVSRDDLRSK